MTDIIFTTVHGSRLYGFEHEGSDYDEYVVVDGHHKPRQRVDGDSDIVTIGVHSFLDYAMGGSHQSVEALFSPVKTWGDSDSARMWRPMLEQLRIQGGDVYAKYERTIKKFCYGDLKRRRHAVRLALNLTYLRRYGRFNSRMPPGEAAACARLALYFEGDDLVQLLLEGRADDQA